MCKMRKVQSIYFTRGYYILNVHDEKTNHMGWKTHIPSLTMDVYIVNDIYSL